MTPYKLIMKDKERLLNINEPLQFIFSHSALREGWDNPNVFQICTLNETKSELKKRQEIGRGLRLPVDSYGNRVFDKSTNILTVIANESYEDFAFNLQREIEDECGVKFEKRRIKDKNQRIRVQYRKGFELDPKFLDIWNRIKYKTKYSVNYDTQELIRDTAKSIKELESISKPQIRSTKVGLDISEEGISTKLISEKKFRYKTAPHELPDILSYIQSKTELTRSTIARIINGSGKLNEVFVNPQLFCDLVVSHINKKKNDLMIDGIKYEKIGNIDYEMRLFEDLDLQVFRSDNDFEVNDSSKTIFEDFIPLDSEVEYQFAKDCESSENIEFYFKLPNWFTIQTPIGKYNPDWALIFKDERKIYFVAETKSTLDQYELRKKETLKIKCGKAHFNEFDDVEYKQVTKVVDLR